MRTPARLAVSEGTRGAYLILRSLLMGLAAGFANCGCGRYLVRGNLLHTPLSRIMEATIARAP